MVNVILGVLAMVGLYFLLLLFPTLQTTVVFQAAGWSFTWFHIIFIVGVLVILKVLVFSK